MGDRGRVSGCVYLSCVEDFLTGIVVRVELV